MSLKAVDTLNNLQQWFLANQVGNKELYVIGIFIVLILMRISVVGRFGLL